jgi:hypothetical protein
MRIVATSSILAMALGLVACRTAAGPERTVEDYARALQEGRLDDAFALTSARSRDQLDRKAFDARYQDPAQRAQRAQALLASLADLRARTPEIEATREGDHWRVIEPGADQGPREALRSFLDAAERGDFVAAYQLLATSWRQRYTPARLAADFKAEPLAKERLLRARAALAGSSAVLRESGAEYPIGEGKAVRLVKEAGGFRVAALE